MIKLKNCLLNKIHNSIKKIKQVNYKGYIRDNTLFFVTVTTLLFNATILRFFTVKNYLSFQPIMADLAVALLLCSFAYFIKPQKRIVYFMSISILLSTICIINSIYYTFYNSYASVSLLVTSLQVAEVGDAVIQNVLQLKDFIFLFQPLIVLFIFVNIKKNGHSREMQNKVNDKAKGLQTVGVAVSLFVLFFITLSPVDISRLVKQWNREFLVMKVGLYTYQINDIVRSLEPRISGIFGYDEVARKVTEYYTNREVSSSKNKYTNIFKGKNIITIHAESIQTFVMDLTFNGEELTPNLNKLARGGLNFNNFYAQVGAGTSSDSEFTLNTSLLPVSSGTVFVSYWDREFVTIPKLLREQNYYSFAMHGNNGAFWNRLVMHKELGYDKLYHRADYEIDEVIGLGLSDKSFFRQSIPMLKKIAEQNEKFYGTMITLTNHTPFDEIEAYGNFPVSIEITIENEFGEEEVVIRPYMEDTRLGNYLKAVHYADAALGEFIEGLDEAGLLENTVIVIYGDHCARLPRRDYTRLYNYDPYTDDLLDQEDPDYVTVDYYNYELNRKVPFIIWTKEEKYVDSIDQVMGMYDILPTLGNMFGFKSYYQLGSDMFSVDENVVIFPNGNWLTNRMYYNNQKQEYFLLGEDVISQEYIDKYQTHAEQVLEISNAIIMYDFINRERETQSLLEEYKR